MGFLAISRLVVSHTARIGRPIGVNREEWIVAGARNHLNLEFCWTVGWFEPLCPSESLKAAATRQRLN
jgi:hypothetical protein